MLDRLKGKIDWSSIQDDLIAAAVGSLAGLAALKISDLANRKITELAASAIGFLVAAVALPLVRMLRGKPPLSRAPKRPDGDRLAIYVARFRNDRDSKMLQDRIENTIQRDFDKTVQVLRADLPRPPAHSDDSESETAAVAATARSLLDETGGDLVIWGKLVPIEAGHCDLHFVSAEDDRPGSFGFREGMLLDANFSAELGSAIAALAKRYARFANKLVPVAASLAPIATRLCPLADHPPDCIRPDDRGFFLDACGQIQCSIGIEAGDNARLEYAIQMYTRALDLLTRVRLPAAWAAVKRHLWRRPLSIRR